MTTSTLGYYVRQRARELAGGGPMSVERTRWTANNLAHLQDEQTQTCASLSAPAGSYWTTKTTPKAAPGAMELAPIPVMLQARADGSSSRVVVTISGFSSIAGKTSTFYASLRPLLIGSAVGSTPPITAATVTASVSTSSALSSRLVATPIYVTRLTDDWLDDVYGKDLTGTRAQVRMYAGQVDIWAASDDASSFPRIEAVTVRVFGG